MSEHTPEPWGYAPDQADDLGGQTIRCPSGMLLGTACAEDDAKRIVACVNACAYIKDPAQSFRDAGLLDFKVAEAGIKHPEHLRELIEAVPDVLDEFGYGETDLPDSFVRLRDALAKVKGKE